MPRYRQHKRMVQSINGLNVWRWILVSLAAAGPAVAQVRVFPKVAAFEYPAGGPRAAGIVGRVVHERRGDSRFGPEQEADVLIGANIPVLGFSRGDHPGFVGLTIRVGGRFSLDDPKTSLISNDWVVGIHGVVDRGPWRVAAELFHESSHLGDEYAETFGARRLDWTHEVAAIWVRRTAGPIVLDGTVGYALIDALPLRRGSAGLGAAYRGNWGSTLGATVRPVVAVFAEGQAYLGWKVTTSGRTGIELDRDGRQIGVGLVYLNGYSTQRQFYDRASRYWGFELRFIW